MPKFRQGIGKSPNLDSIRHHADRSPHLAKIQGGKRPQQKFRVKSPSLEPIPFVDTRRSGKLKRGSFAHQFSGFHENRLIFLVAKKPTFDTVFAPTLDRHNLVNSGILMQLLSHASPCPMIRQSSCSGDIPGSKPDPHLKSPDLVRKAFQNHTPIATLSIQRQFKDDSLKNRFI